MKPPYLITVRELIREVPDRWDELRVRDKIALREDVEKLRKLRLLDVETCSAADVEAIIGNEWWVLVQCSQCQRSVDAVVVVGEEFDDINPDTATAQLCRDCLAAACALMPPPETTSPGRR